jgi:succinate dehydrogenase / fumarate reductase membrane anchor subunit
MVNRVVTGAHYGLRDWLVQRITAAVMAVYTLFFAGYLLLQSPVDYDIWSALFSNNAVRSFTFLFLLCVFYHAWIGMRDIVMDYVQPAGVRLAIHVAVILVLILYTIWSVQILWGL